MNGLVASYLDLELHVILDNLNTHKPMHDRWRARHPKVRFHYSCGCRAGVQQALQIHQLFACQFGESDDASHANSVAFITPQVKSNITILMNRATRM